VSASQSCTLCEDTHVRDQHPVQSLPVSIQKMSGQSSHQVLVEASCVGSENDHLLLSLVAQAFPLLSNTRVQADHTCTAQQIEIVLCASWICRAMGPASRKRASEIVRAQSTPNGVL